jgi:hypothetical protein
MVVVGLPRPISRPRAITLTKGDVVELVNHGICPSLPSWSNVLGWLAREECYVHVEWSHC